MKICYYISDYGYGHASRSIEIIRKILDNIANVQIFIRTDYTFDFVRKSLPEKVNVFRSRNDVGVVYKKESLELDYQKTETSLLKWLSSWEGYIEKEIEFCKSRSIDLIISDITPQAFVIAKRLGIKSLGISNFSWYDIYQDIFNLHQIEKIKQAYTLADAFLVLPFSEKLDYIPNKKNINLISREVSESPSKIRSKLGVDEKDILIFLSAGKSLDWDFFGKMEIPDNENIKFLVSSHIDLENENFRKLPEEETESQNYIAACDLAITKSGYSTIAECIVGRVPVLLIKREKFSEDDHVGEMITKNNLGKVISINFLQNTDWINEIDNISQYRENIENLENRYRNSGSSEVINTIRRLMN